MFNMLSNNEVISEEEIINREQLNENREQKRNESTLVEELMQDKSALNKNDIVSPFSSVDMNLKEA